MLAEQRYKILFIQYVKEHLILTFYTTSEEADTSREENLWLRLGISVRGSREDIERILNGDTETLRKLLDAGRYGIGGETYVPGSTVEGYNEDHDTEFEEEDVEFHL